MTDININALSEAINDKLDRDLSNTSSNPDVNTFLDALLSKGIDVVIESQMPTAENGYTWYRKYKSGWIEQGGYIATTTNQSANSNVNIGNPILPIPMLDTNYITSYNHRRTGSYWTFMETTISNTSTTQIKIDLYNNGSGTWTPGSDDGIYWEVKGMAA